ncbi:MAG: DUF2065 domain-containing protein [Deltaproteobacteria bacterium]|nr:DUF2065 domain-containing protein [Deltaproteobacteria bacterium]
MELFLCVIGMVLIVEGLPYFTFPEKMKELMRVVSEQDDMILRTAGAAMTLLGMAIVFLARGGLGYW